mgnify:FL=1
MLKKFGVIPVVTLAREADAVPVLGALQRGGLPVAEICFRTDCAAACIARGRKAFPDLCIGAGTVLDGAQCVRALEAGAQFIVSPGFSEEAAAVCAARKVFYLPGCATPTEIMRALAAGLTTLKFFPADVYGGLPAIRALSAAFPQVRFVPTGGVNERNLPEYLSFEKIDAVGGSWLAKGTPEEIEEKARRAVQIVREVRP